MTAGEAFMCFSRSLGRKVIRASIGSDPGNLGKGAPWPNHLLLRGQTRLVQIRNHIRFLLIDPVQFAVVEFRLCSATGGKGLANLAKRSGPLSDNVRAAFLHLISSPWGGGEGVVYYLQTAACTDYSSISSSGHVSFIRSIQTRQLLTATSCVLVVSQSHYPQCPSSTLSGSTYPSFSSFELWQIHPGSSFPESSAYDTIRETA